MTDSAAFKDTDKILLNIGDEIFAIDASMVAGVVEAERVYLLPLISQRSSLEKGAFIRGVITQRGEVVVVISLERLFGFTPTTEGRPYRVAIIKKDASSIGVYISRKELSFLWKEELASLDFKRSDNNYTVGFIDPSGRNIRLLDLQKVLEDTQKHLELTGRYRGNR